MINYTVILLNGNFVITKSLDPTKQILAETENDLLYLGIEQSISDVSKLIKRKLKSSDLSKYLGLSKIRSVKFESISQVNGSVNMSFRMKSYSDITKSQELIIKELVEDAISEGWGEHSFNLLTSIPNKNICSYIYNPINPKTEMIIVKN